MNVVGLTKHFPVRRGFLFQHEVGRVHAVDSVSFAVAAGTSFGLVGESGSGKTTVAKLILRIEQPTAGTITYRDRDIFHLSSDEDRQYRRTVQAVFQDPYSSLSPRMAVWEIITEPLRVSQSLSEKALKSRAGELLETVGLAPDRVNAYPHQFSGGQRQRLAIARALSANPEFIVLDEPVSGLDVSIRAQILNLLKDLQDRFGLTLFMISHDLASLRYLSGQIAVMYLGEIVEIGPSEQVYNQPRHPYTKALLSSIPMPFAAERAKRQRIILSGEVPSAIAPPSGCRFHTRCPVAIPVCAERSPELREIAPAHHAACHLLTSEPAATPAQETRG